MAEVKERKASRQRASAKGEKSVSKKYSFKERQEEKSKVRQGDLFCPVRRDEEHGLKKGIDAHCTNSETLKVILVKGYHISD